METQKTTSNKCVGHENCFNNDKEKAQVKMNV